MPLRPLCTHLPVTLFLAAVLSACATTKMAAEWTNKEYAGKALKAHRILVVCQAPDPTVQRICEDQLMAAVSARGAIAVRPDSGATGAAPANAPTPAEAYRDAAAAAAASAVMNMTIEPDATVVNPGPVIGIGIGGGSFSGGGWGRGGGSFGGVGGSVGMPVGGGSVQQGLSASTTLLDSANGQVIWSGRAVSPPSQAFEPQISELTRVTFEAMQKAGVL